MFISLSKVQSRRASPLESFGWRGSHKASWALKSPNIIVSGEDGTLSRSSWDGDPECDLDGGQYKLHTVTHERCPILTLNVEVSVPWTDDCCTRSNTRESLI